MVNKLSPTSSKPIKSSLRSWDRPQLNAGVEREVFRVDFRRDGARVDLGDLVRLFDDELLARRRREVGEVFFLTTRYSPIGAIIAWSRIQTRSEEVCDQDPTHRRIRFSNVSITMYIKQGDFIPN
jgi:hypothetical protein